MTATEPSAGAVRLARELFFRAHDMAACVKLDATGRYSEPKEENVLFVAELIDQESGLAELLKCCELMLPYFDGSRGATDGNVSRIVAVIEKVAGRSIEATKHLNAAIAKASNPNAETVQSYPSGRWTEKGTV